MTNGGLAALCMLASAGAAGCARGAWRPRVERWIVDGTAAVHGLAPEVLGAPTPTATPWGQALCFDGDDGLLLPANPLEGLRTFTLEVLLRVDADGAPGAPAEPRFLHVEATDGARATMEARVSGTSFYLDTFLRAGERRYTVANPSRTHPTGAWVWAALTYDGAYMTNFVNGAEEAGAELPIPPLGPGKTSLGVRQNLVHWFKGCIRELRVTAKALVAADLQRLDGR